MVDIDDGIYEIIVRLNKIFKLKKIDLSTAFSCEGHINSIIDSVQAVYDSPHIYIMFKGKDLNIIKDNPIIKKLKNLKYKNLEHQMDILENDRFILGYYLVDTKPILSEIKKFNKIKCYFQNILWEYIYYMEKN